MLWEELSWPRHGKMSEAGATVVMPFASIEQHGPHLPVEVDTRLVTSVCREATQEMDNVLLVPTMWAGFSPHHMGFPGTLTLSLETYTAVVQDLVRSVAAHGYRKVLVVNGHGGNIPALQACVSSLRQELGIELWMVSYFHLGGEIAKLVRKSDIGGMGHAGEYETAMMLHLRGDLVDMKEAVRNPNNPKHPLMSRDMHHGGPLYRPPDSNERRPSGITGDATVADAETGAEFFRHTVARLREVVRALAET